MLLFSFDNKDLEEEDLETYSMMGMNIYRPITFVIIATVGISAYYYFILF